MERHYRVSFVTPAFLGDAEQKGHWRTPPFKALLRQWWRVAKAKDVGYDHACLRECEGRLFGHAWLQNRGKTWAMQSRVRLRLDAWEAGGVPSLRELPGYREATVPVGQFKVNANVYLGYGPVDQKSKDLTHPPAIGIDDQHRLRVAYPSCAATEMALALTLAAWLGTLGGRSRNGWGSLCLRSEDGEDGPIDTADVLRRPGELGKVARDIDECLTLDWPHALGKDSAGLLAWRTEAAFGNWQELVRLLAQLRAESRRKFPLSGHGKLSARHLFSYPIAQRPVAAWGQNERFANQLRLKAVPDGTGNLVGLVFHMPCRVPLELDKKIADPSERRVLAREAQQAMWQKVHRYLDGRSELSRLGGC